VRGRMTPWDGRSQSIQAGTVQVVVSGGVGSTAVVFDTEFATAPIVNLTIVDGSPTSDHLGISAPTTTGFTAFVNSGTNTTYTVHWIAVEQTQ